MATSDTQAQLTTTATTGQLTATTAITPTWDDETFGIGTSAETEGEQEDNYDTNKYFRTHDGRWYSKDEINEAIWDKFKEVYNWKHMRGSTANAISNDVLDIINGLYNGDLTIDGGLLYTVKGSKNYDKYSSWKSKYEGNKPHHANSKYDSDAKNNAAWVVMLAFGTLTDEGSKKKSLQESTSTNNFATLKQEIYNDMLFNLGISDFADLTNWYDLDALNDSTHTRGVTYRLNNISDWINEVGTEYSSKDLNKEYGLNNKLIDQFRSVLLGAYKAIQDKTIDSGDLNALDKLTHFLGMDLRWRDLLKTNFATPEEEEKMKEKKEKEAKEKTTKANDQIVSDYISSVGRMLSQSPYNFKEITNINHKINSNDNLDCSIPDNNDTEYTSYKDNQTLSGAKAHFKALTNIVEGLESENNNPSINGIGHLLKYCIDNNILRKDSQNPNLYYFPSLDEYGGVWVVRIRGAQEINPLYELDYVKFTTIPDLKTKLVEFYKLHPTWGDESLTAFEEFLDW